MEIMKCGSCGCDKATIRAQRVPRGVTFDRLVLTCVDCGEETTFAPTAPTMTLSSPPDQVGQFCVGWRS